MARRGFFAELQHQSRVAARDRERAERVAVREHQAALRLAEQTRKALSCRQHQGGLRLRHFQSGCIRWTRSKDWADATPRANGPYK
jgi:hypothetical protein